MSFQNNKRTQNIFLTIIGITFVCLIINIPKSIPAKIHVGNFNWEHTFYRPDFKFNIAGRTFQKQLDLKYGLDLAGGASVLFDIDTNKIKKEEVPIALQSLKDNIERRVNLFGISEANVQLSNENGNNRLKIELPGVEDVDQAITLIGKTAQLSFKGVKDVPPEATASTQFDDVFQETGLNGSHLVSATVEINQNNSQPEVALVFNNDGTKLFEKATKDFLHKKIAIFLDDQVITAPNVEVEITDGRAVINGSFDTKSAKQLAAQLNAGALPLPITIIQQSEVKATLGQDSIDKGVKAGVIGLILVMAFMIGNYGYLGFIADLSLIVYALITLTLYRLIPITLTFPGIVGFILSVGMAVDANILIFARMREELRKGKPWNIAMELGFGRAWNSIKDANACTIITGLILFNPFNLSFLNSSGMVRGFALTLILGVFISIFTGVVVTRNFLRVLASHKEDLK